MAVPNTNTFSLNDVRLELGLASNTNLSACFTASVDGSFDPSYKGAKDRLSNFRNYGAAVPTPITVTPTFVEVGLSNPSPLITVTVPAGVNWSAATILGGGFYVISPNSGTGPGSFAINYVSILNENRDAIIRVSRTGGSVDIFVQEVD